MTSAPSGGGKGLLWSEDGLKLGLKVGEFHKAYRTLLHFSVFEEKDSRDVAHAVFACDLIVVVDVEFAYGHLVAVFFSEFLHDWAEFDAGATPSGPEVDHYGFSALDSLTGCLVVEFQHDSLLFDFVTV